MSDKTMPGTSPKMRLNSFCASYRSDLHCRLRNEERHKLVIDPLGLKA